MGVDLSLVPVKHDSGRGAIYPHTVIDLNRRRELWAEIEAAKIEKPLGRGVYWTAGEDESLQVVTENPYGSPWTFATAGELAKVIGDWVEEYDPDSWENKAAVAYLRALPPDMTVVLRWH